MAARALILDINLDQSLGRGKPALRERNETRRRQLASICAVQTLAKGESIYASSAIRSGSEAPDRQATALADQKPRVPSRSGSGLQYGMECRAGDISHVLATQGQGDCFSDGRAVPGLLGKFYQSNAPLGPVRGDPARPILHLLQTLTNDADSLIAICG